MAVFDLELEAKFIGGTAHRLWVRRSPIREHIAVVGAGCQGAAVLLHLTREESIKLADELREAAEGRFASSLPESSCESSILARKSSSGPWLPTVRCGLPVGHLGQHEGANSAGLKAQWD